VALASGIPTSPLFLHLLLHCPCQGSDDEVRSSVCRRVPRSIALCGHCLCRGADCLPSRRCHSHPPSAVGSRTNLRSRYYRGPCPTTSDLVPLRKPLKAPPRPVNAPPPPLDPFLLLLLLGPLSFPLPLIVLNSGGLASDEDGVTIEPAQPLVGENITVTVKGQLLKRVTAGTIDVDLRLMKFIKLQPQFDLCEQLEEDMFAESNVSCPLEKGAVTLIAKKYIPEDVPKVSVEGNITLTNQDGDMLTCTYPSPSTCLFCSGSLCRLWMHVGCMC
jgi:hypothetical protein